MRDQNLSDSISLLSALCSNTSVAIDLLHAGLFSFIDFRLREHHRFLVPPLYLLSHSIPPCPLSSSLPIIVSNHAEPPERYTPSDLTLTHLT